MIYMGKMTAKERDTIAFHALADSIEHQWFFENMTLCDEAQVRKEVKEINEMITARNMLARKLGMGQRPKEQLSELLAEHKRLLALEKDV